MEQAQYWYHATKERMGEISRQLREQQIDEDLFERKISAWIDRLDAALIKHGTIDQSEYDLAMGVISKVN